MENPFEKRIKRQVAGKSHAFFTIVSPGIEAACEAEFFSLGTPVPDIKREKGGIGFSGRLHDCYHANLHLRTASRILMRIGECKVTNFRELFRKIVQIPWELYLSWGLLPEMNIASHGSRLFHKEAIQGTILSGIEKRWEQLAEREPSSLPPFFSPQVFARMADDLLTLSIDSSGDILYKRGIKTGKGRAPIRETIAAAALKIAGYDGSLPLIDPLCGSGTFSIEAAMIRKNLPPGWFRNFAFMDWPSFQKGRWAHERREAEKMIRPLDRPLVFASDKDASALLGLRERLSSSGLLEEIELSCRDFFSFTPSQVTTQKGVVVLNPPYGVRLGTEAESDRFFDQIIKKLRKDYRGFKAVIIASGVNREKRMPFEAFRSPFFHGGLMLDMIIGHIP